MKGHRIVNDGLINSLILSPHFRFSYIAILSESRAIFDSICSQFTLIPFCFCESIVPNQCFLAIQHKDKIAFNPVLLSFLIHQVRLAKRSLTKIAYDRRVRFLLLLSMCSHSYTAHC